VCFAVIIVNAITKLRLSFDLFGRLLTKVQKLEVLAERQPECKFCILVQVDRGAACSPK